MPECSSFSLFTDDIELPTFKAVKQLLEQTHLPFSVGPQSGTERYENSYIDDFA